METNLVEDLRDGHITAEEFMFIFDIRVRDAFRKAMEMAIEFTKEYGQ